MASSLTIGSATYGVDKSGISKLKANFDGDVKRLKNTVKGPAYDNIIKTVKANWAGADAEAFLKKLATDKDKISKRIDELDKKMDQAIDAAYNEFIKFQSTNKIK